MSEWQQCVDTEWQLGERESVIEYARHVGKMKKAKNRRRGSKPLYEARHGVAHCRKKKLCAECGKKLRGRRTRWCSDKCITTYMIRSDPSEARRQVGFRDKGICAACALDCLELAKKVKGATLAAHDRWWEERGREGTDSLNPKGLRGNETDVAEWGTISRDEKR